MYLRGDPVGVYGHYTPATMPLTLPLPEPPYAEPRNPYHLFGGNY